jgi:Zn-dependent metalloprotease
MLSFWDGTDVNLPPQAQFLPDLTYHETAQAFVSRVRSFTYQGESGSIQQSYANVLASLIKQERSGRKGREADWILVPGAVAWLKGESVENPKDLSPLISLKAPGTAYDDAGGVHINVGIPNKAFYETAVELGSDRAREMWRAALPKLPKTPKLQTLADQIYREAKTDAERQAVKDAWAKVGINTPTTT